MPGLNVVVGALVTIKDSLAHVPQSNRERGSSTYSSTLRATYPGIFKVVCDGDGFIWEEAGSLIVSNVIWHIYELHEGIENFLFWNYSKCGQTSHPKRETPIGRPVVGKKAFFLHFSVDALGQVEPATSALDTKYSLDLLDGSNLEIHHPSEWMHLRHTTVNLFEKASVCVPILVG